jgi:glutamine synthetase
MTTLADPVPGGRPGAFTACGRETREAGVRVITGTAGLDGMTRSTRLFQETTGNPGLLDAGQARAPGGRRRPASPGEAVAEFRADEALRTVLGPVLTDAMIAVRRGEITAVDGLGDGRIAAAYRRRY